MDKLVVLLILHIFGHGQVRADGILYPRESETRQVASLDGLWNFAVSPGNLGHLDKWYSKKLKNIKGIDAVVMPVPSSYNDITTDPRLRDHMGYVWYERSFFVPKYWTSSRVWLRFSSVSYAAQVWINGKLAVQHEIGHLPFQVEINKFISYGKENSITVACDNTLTETSIPQGEIIEVETDSGIKHEQAYTFDFFNYAGIHRPVVLFTTPSTYIDDVTIYTDVENDCGMVHYDVKVVGPQKYFLGLKLYDSSNTYTRLNSSESGWFVVKNPNLWWPYLMDPNPGHLYTLEISLLNEAYKILDIYRLQVGIRKLEWNESGMYINNKRLYLHGFGRHEDSEIRGRGLDLPTVLRDYSLIKWVGGNAYRTSHYPYAEEIMDIADQMGIMIIDECPAVNIDLPFSEKLKTRHMQSLTELVRRDKNRPSVIAWSIANEPRSQRYGADTYFGAIANHTRGLDNKRPITGSIDRGFFEDQMGKHLDIISFNKYNAWYTNDGKLNTIKRNIMEEARAWRNMTNKPILVSEYGADTIPGFHALPQYIWSEEFQVDLMSKHFEAFDELRSEGWFVGEFIWNFADFQTAQTHTRAGGNRKGIFTRNRQPKAAAHHLRRRYFTLAQELYNVTLPDDLYNYVGMANHANRDEL